MLPFFKNHISFTVSFLCQNVKGGEAQPSGGGGGGGGKLRGQGGSFPCTPDETLPEGTISKGPESFN